MKSPRPCIAQWHSWYYRKALCEEDAQALFRGIPIHGRKNIELQKTLKN